MTTRRTKTGTGTTSELSSSACAAPSDSGAGIGEGQCGRRPEHLRRLPLPERVQLQAKVIEVPASEHGAEGIRLPVRSR
jgi:hypothetical protein